MKWIEIFFNTINNYSLFLIVILSIINITFALFSEIRDKKSFKIIAASLSILILLLSSMASIYESKNIEGHYSTAINTLINTDSLIDKAQRNNQLINDNLVLSKDLSDKTTKVSKNTLKIFNKLIDKDSYCYIDVDSFWHIVKHQQKKINFCIKHEGNYAINNVSVTIQNTSKAFCLNAIYRTIKEWLNINNLTTTSYQFPAVYPGTELTFDYNLNPELKIPNDSTAFNALYYIGEDGKRINMFDKFCGEDYITLQINVFTPNKKIDEIIIIENYSNLEKRKISITVRDKAKVLKNIEY